MPVNKQATLVSTPVGCFFTRIKHAFLPLGSFRQNAPPSPLVSRAQRSVKRSATVRCRPGIVMVHDDRGSAMYRSLSLALHRIRDTQASDGFANPIHFSNSPSRSRGACLRPGFATKLTNLLA